MGHEHRGRAELALQALDLGPGVDPQAGIEVGERLVHQQHGRVADHGAADRDPLALATGQIGRAALQERPQPQHVGGRLDLALDHLGREPLLAQAEADIVAHAHMRVERVVLEHHGDVALMGLELGHVPGIEPDRAAARLLQPGDAGERGALAAAGRPQERQELAIGDRDVEPGHCPHLAEALLQSLQRHARHVVIP